MIPTRLHGLLDYLWALLLMVSPWWLGFADGSAAMWTAVALGLVTILASLLTRYEWGLVPRIPMATHLWLDFAVGLALAFAPWVFHFDERIWWPHLTFGLFAVTAAMFTQLTPLAERAIHPHAPLHRHH